MIVDRDVAGRAAARRAKCCRRSGRARRRAGPRRRSDWSNELVAHVVEMKNVAPTPALDTLPRCFAAALRDANELLGPWMRG